MFDHEGVKTAKVTWSLSILFSHVKSKSWSLEKYEDKGPNMHNPNQFMTFQNLPCNFSNEFLMWFFLQDLVVFEVLFQEPSILTIDSQVVDCNRHPCTKFWIEKS